MHLFAGAGGGLLADLILGHEPVVAVEWDKYACRVLRERAADGWFPDLRVWEGDVRLFDPSEYAGGVDCIAAGFPCQDISGAGNQAGVGEGTRSGLYREVLRIADIVRPRFLFLENVAAILANDFLGTVLGDLAARGYDARWCCLEASGVGAPHKRDRWWCLATMAGASCRRFGEPESGEVEQSQGTEAIGESAYSNAEGCGLERKLQTRCNEEGRGKGVHSQSGGMGGGQCEDVADTECFRRNKMVEPVFRGTQGKRATSQIADCCFAYGGSRRESESHFCRMADGLAAELDGSGWWSIEPEVGRTAARIPNRAARIKALGNGQVPIQAATAWVILGGPITQ